MHRNARVADARGRPRGGPRCRGGGEHAAAAARRLAAPKTVEALVKGEAGRVSARRTWAVADPTTDRAARAAGAVAGEAFTQAAVLVTGQPATVLARRDLPWLRGAAVDPRTLIRSDVAKLDPQRPNSMALWARAAIDQPLVALNRVAGLTNGAYVVKVQTQFCVPPNPTAKMLRMRAEANLLKIRTCRNFAGLQCDLEPYAAPTGAEGALPRIGPGGQLVLAGLSQARPTPYRYTALIERAKQLVELSSRFESAMLDAIRNKENEEYTLLRARQDLKLARAGVRLQDLKVTEASQGVKLAQLQQNRAQFQVNHYASLIEEGLSGLEIAALALLGASAGLQVASSVASFVAAALPSSTGVTGPTFSPQGSASAIASGLSSQAGAAATTSSILSTQASYERRAQEWAFQKGLAEQDVAIGAQQVLLAESRVNITEQERAIANLQADNAESVVNFLSNKFLTAELYIDVAFSFRNQFADAWYDLHNPDQTAPPLLPVAVSVTRADFAPHLTDLRLEQVALLAVSDERPHPLDAETLTLRFAENDAGPQVGGNARPLDGLATTRGATGTAWLAMTGRAPVGRYRGSLSDTPAVREMFARRALRDIVLVLTCRATLPEEEV